MKTTRSTLLAALVLVLPASLLSSTESQLQTDLSGVLTIDFFVDIFSQSNLQVTAAGPAIVRGPNPSLVNTVQVSFPINGGAINQSTLRSRGRYGDCIERQKRHLIESSAHIRQRLRLR